MSDESTNLGVRVPLDLAKAFERIAAQNDRTVSAELRRIMREHVEAHPDEQPKAAAA